MQRDEEKEGNASKTGERAPTGRRGLLATAFGLMTSAVLFISAVLQPLNKTHPWFVLCLQGRFKAENLNQRLRHQMANYVVPGVSEYLQARVECKRLQQDIHTWERKVRIAQVYFTSSDPVGDGRPHCSMSPHFSRKCCAQTLSCSPLFGSDDREDQR